jgi:hypothetical protein
MPTAHKPPLYPLALALGSKLAGSGYVAHQVGSAVMGSATAFVLGLVSNRVAGRRAALIAAGLAAVYPVFIATDASLRSESLYALLLALVLLAAYGVLERPSGLRLALLGAAIGLAALTRSEALALLVLLVVPLVWRSEGGRRALRLAIVAAACLAVLAPWLVRTWAAFDKPVLISTNSGDLIAGANCDSTYYGPHPGGWAFDCIVGVRGSNEAVIADRLRDRGLRYARDHADRLPAVLAIRALRPWGFYEPRWEIELRERGEGADETMDTFGLLTFWALLVLAVRGVVLLRRRGEPLFVLAAPVVLVVLVSVLSYGVLRFRAAADLAVIVLAAVALEALLRRSSGRRRPRPA